ncbi:Polycomb group protein EMBRYONIC FLOWER 2 [Acorus gramineus]|uniref:Polycomb group protein EMBRYONIC FLOWER 2 n=1 Tax=Acorus gramineus TaxID=55184 RepID=A0AAV9ACT6_ACOGR|nr:Polycomb group protein EMBRYONIC FLOWER 2 [Acorus gramineus]
MPGLPLVVHDTTNFGCSCSFSRAADQMCRQDSRVHLSVEEAIAAEESLSIYCKPVELYNILQRRASQNPSFLQRSLHYKIQARRRRRIHLSISLQRNANEVQSHKIFPLYILLARPVVNFTGAESSAVYQLSRACLLTSYSGLGDSSRSEASFILPEMMKLSAEAKAGNLTILFVSHGEAKCSSHKSDTLKDDVELMSFPSMFEGNCTWGNLPLETIHSSLENCVNLSMGHKSEMLSTIDMHPGVLQSSSKGQDKCIAFQIPRNSGSMCSSWQVQVNIHAQEVGVKERSPYDSYTYDNVPSLLLPHIIQLRAGNVIFNYKYYNNTLQKTEVTEDFSCPFCLVKCASFKGLRYHLTLCHDLFNFEFWVTEEYQAVNVSVKTDTWTSEIAADGRDPRLQTFFFCSSKFKRRRKNDLVHNANPVHPHVKLDSMEVGGEDSPEGYHEKDTGTSFHAPITPPTDAEPSNRPYRRKSDIDGVLNKGAEKTAKASFGESHLQSARRKSESYCSENPCPAECAEPIASSPDTVGVCAATAQASSGNEYPHPASACGNHLVPVGQLCVKTKKLSADRSDPRNRALLQKRQFFHSHRAQPMTLEQVLSDRDSEDEIDDDIADFEDRRMLDDFVDVTNDEKHMMHLWNSFVRKQRVLADGHIPWACEAFSRLHGRDLVHAPALIWCWRLFMIKLWNHSLLDGRSMNNCNLILERYKNEDSDVKKS